MVVYTKESIWQFDILAFSVFNQFIVQRNQGLKNKTMY